MDKVDLIVKVLKDWREAADNFGVDSSQAKERGAIAMPLLFENRELLPESNQRFQLRELEDTFTIDEIKTMNDGGNCGFYAKKNFIADLEKHIVQGKVGDKKIAEEPEETGGNATPAKGWGITTLFKNIIEKGWQIFTKSFWEAVLDRVWPKQ